MTDERIEFEDGVQIGIPVNSDSTTSYYDIGFIPKEFEINDITIIYREKPIK